jgi:hypothetical protein
LTRRNIFEGSFIGTHFEYEFSVEANDEAMRTLRSLPGGTRRRHALRSLRLSSAETDVRAGILRIQDGAAVAIQDGSAVAICDQSA